MRTHLSIFIFSAALLLPAAGNAFNKGTWRVGALAGQIGVQGDVGKTQAGATDPNSVGFGLTAGTYVDEELAVEGSLIFSSHENLEHTNLSFGANYYFGDYVAAYPNAVAGVSFISNEVQDTKVSGDAFGLYLGGGFDFELNPQITTGIQLRFTKAFEESKATANGVQVATAGDTFMVLLRAMYTFDSAE